MTVLTRPGPLLWPRERETEGTRKPIFIQQTGRVSRTMHRLRSHCSKQSPKVSLHPIKRCASTFKSELLPSASTRPSFILFRLSHALFLSSLPSPLSLSHPYSGIHDRDVRRIFRRTPRSFLVIAIAMNYCRKKRASLADKTGRPAVSPTRQSAHTSSSSSKKESAKTSPAGQVSTGEIGNWQRYTDLFSNHGLRKRAPLETRDIN